MFNAKWAVLATAVLGLSSQLLMAADPGDVYQATYFYNLRNCTEEAAGATLNLGAGADASITILDPGVNAPANICANIYVLNPSEELEACCSVLLTPDEIVQGQLSLLVTQPAEQQWPGQRGGQNHLVHCRHRYGRLPVRIGFDHHGP